MTRLIFLLAAIILFLLGVICGAVSLGWLAVKSTQREEEKKEKENEDEAGLE